MTEPDRWGNTWTDGAVPGAHEIAEVFIEARRQFGWGEVWGDYRGFYVCPRVRLWLDAYTDRDYEEGFLFRVWTESDPTSEGLNVTVTDHLAVYHSHKGTEVAWRQEPRLFFDVDRLWAYDGLRWWVDWLEAYDEMVGSEGTTSDLVQAHNDKIRDEQRERARALGLAPALPYLGTSTANHTKSSC